MAIIKESLSISVSPEGFMDISRLLLIPSTRQPISLIFVSLSFFPTSGLIGGTLKLVIFKFFKDVIVSNSCPETCLMTSLLT